MSIALGPGMRVARLAAVESWPREETSVVRNERFVHESEAIRALMRTAEKVANRDMPVLLQGETGTGKEVLARFLHQHGRRASHPLVCVNCGSIPAQLVESTLFGHERGAFTDAVDEKQGVFQAANGGTLLLDELGELPLAAQAALLRVLETRRLTRVGGTQEIPVDVRIIGASHLDIERMVAVGRFRQDLLYRLNAIVLEIPPLRARRADIAPLALHFLREACGANEVPMSFEPAALSCIERYDWPGNIRELRNVIERAVALADDDRITLANLPESLGAKTTSGIHPVTREGPTDFRSLVERYETSVIQEAIAACDGNQTQAARRLGMPLRTLVYKLRAHRSRRGFGG